MMLVKRYDRTMLGRLYENQICSAARALELVGERWSLLILRDALARGFTRFSQFQRSLDIAPNILARRLEGFVAAGIMEARQQGAHRDHQSYHLTAKGLDLGPVVIALTLWGDKWAGPGPVLFEHKDCGGRLEQKLRCADCGAVPEHDDIMVKRRTVATPEPESGS